MTRYGKTMAESLKEVYSLNEDNMDLMKKAAAGAMQTIKFKDGKLKMDSFTASAIMAVHKAVNDKNKKSIEQMINTGTKAQIMKLQSLAMRQIKSGYHEKVELDEAKYEIKNGKVHISKKEFAKVSKDYKGKDTMTVLDPKTGATVNMPVVFEEVELDEGKFQVKSAASKKGKITVTDFDSLKDAEKHLAGMEKKGHKGIISKDGKPVFRGTPVEIKKQMKAHKKKHDKIGIGEDMTVTGSTDGGISQRDLDHVQKELRRLGIKDAVVDQNEKDSTKLDVKTRMNDAAVKKAFDKSKMTVTYEHVQLEGTWHVPETPKDLAGLKKLLKKPVIFGKDGDTAIDFVGHYIGDDQLYDDLHDEGKRNPKDDARPLIRARMKQLGIKEETILDRIDRKLKERKNG